MVSITYSSSDVLLIALLLLHNCWTEGEPQLGVLLYVDNLNFIISRGKGL